MPFNRCMCEMSSNAIVDIDSTSVPSNKMEKTVVHYCARVGPRDVVYENPIQQVYRVQVELGDFVKDMYVTDYGERVGLVVEGA